MCCMTTQEEASPPDGSVFLAIKACSIGKSVKVSVVAIMMDHREIHEPELGNLIQVFAVA